MGSSDGGTSVEQDTGVDGTTQPRRDDRQVDAVVSSVAAAGAAGSERRRVNDVLPLAGRQAAVLLVDLSAEGPSQVVFANPVAQQLAPGLALPAPVEEWSRRAGLQGPGGQDLQESAHPLARVAAGEPVGGMAVTAARASADSDRREPLLAVGVRLQGAPGDLDRQVLVALIPQREAEVVGEAQTAALAADLTGTALAATDVSFTISDPSRPDNPLVWVNDAFTRTTGYASEQVLGRNCRLLQGAGTDPTVVARIRAAVAERTPITEVILNYRSDGSSFWNQVGINPVFDGAGSLVNFVGVQTDVTAAVHEAAEQAATQETTAQALAAERLARQASEQDRHRLRLLAQASSALSATLDVVEIAQRLCRGIAATIADGASVTLVDENEVVSHVIAHHRDGHGDALGRYRALRRRGLTPGGATHRAVHGRQEPVLRNDLTPAQLLELTGDADVAAALGAMGLTGLILVPLVARRRVLGTLTLLSTDSERRFDDRDLDVARDLASRAALALDNARLYAVEHDAALTLQRSMLPKLISVPGMRISATYLPGSTTSEVGGDWYDVLPLPDGSTGLAIGDVMGHDMIAAAAMGQVRSVLRAYAWQGDRPSRVLDRVDHLIGGLDMAALTTCIYAQLEPPADRSTGRSHLPWQLRWANAGHHPPLLQLPDGGVRALDGGASALLGLGGSLRSDSPRDEGSAAMPAGSTLVLFTDGLVEHRGASIDDGMREVEALLDRHRPEAGPEALNVALADFASGRGQEDDICLLAVQVDR